MIKDPTYSRFNLDVPEYIIEYGRSNLLKVVGDDPSPWCKNDPPLSYSYVQVNAKLLHMYSTFYYEIILYLLNLHDCPKSEA